MIKREDIAALLTGLMATFAGLGIARFAYTPLMSELIRQEWFQDTQAVYLGAAALLGYLVGALSAHWLSERLSNRLLMGGCFLSIGLSFILSSQPGSFEWFFLWRTIAGVCGAILMVVGPSTALCSTPESRRARVGPLVFTGIGLGVVFSASVIPALLQYSLSVTWLILGLLSLVAGLICNQCLAKLSAQQASHGSSSASKLFLPHLRWGLALVMAAYALDAIGYVPHTVFWVDFLAREKALGMSTASTQWMIFGAGAICGPFIAGTLARRTGMSSTLTLALVAKALAVGLPLLSVALYSRTLSSFLVGAMVPGVVALTSGRIAELVGSAEHKRYWGVATAVFAAAQALSGYVMSALYEAWGNYQFLFLIGSITLAIGVLLVILSSFLSRQ